MSTAHPKFWVTGLAAIGMLLACAAGPAAAQWMEILKLLPSDSAAGDRFGNAVATDGNRIIVGAMSDDDRGSSSGAAYVFYHGSSGWVQEVKLVPADIGAGDQFGIDVDIAGDRLIVGAYSLDGATGGVAYIYELVGGVWTQAARLRPTGLSITDQFGVSVGISTLMAVVGAPYDDDRAADAGCAYVYLRGATTWEQRTILSPSDGVANDRFGTSVDVIRNWSSNPAPSGYFFVVGAPGDDDAGTDVGSLYVWDKDFMTDPGWRWVKLIPAGLSAYAGLGSYVAISGYFPSVLVASVPSSSGAGAAYVYAKDTSGPGWTLQSTLIPSDGVAGDGFGRAVAIDAYNENWKVCVGAPYAVVTGASAGAAYLFETYSGGVRQLPRMTAHDRALDDYFGTSVGVSWNIAAIGASGNDDFGSRSGSAYVFSNLTDIWLRGTAWEDVDGDGVRDAEDVGRANWIIFLDTNGNGVLDAGEWAGQTGADGSYVMANVPAGTHVVTEQSQDEWVRTFPAGPGTYTVTVVLGQRVANLDFGNHHEAPSGIQVADRSVLWLAQNHPNPFNPRTTLTCNLPRDGLVSLAIFDARGAKVQSLIDGPLAAGVHRMVWDGMGRGGEPAPSGVYFARLTGPDGTQTVKLTLAR